MALTFGANISDNVTIGASSSISSLSLGTLLFWTKPNSVANAVKDLLFKTSGGTGGIEILKRGVDGTQIRAWLYSTTAVCVIDIISNTGFLAVDTWKFMAITWEKDTAANCKIYGGGLTTAAADATASATASGTPGDAPLVNMVIGNVDVLNIAWPGSIAWVGMWNRVLTLGEIKDQQFHPHKTSGCVLSMHLGYNGTGTQPDWSGNANAGTVTGATVSAHVPVRPVFGANAWTPYIPPVVVGNPWYAYAQQ